MYIEKKGVAKWIILSILTCGIGGLIWFIQLTDDAAKASNDNSTSGVKSFLLGIVTCGIYLYIWPYKMGKMINEARIKNGMTPDDSSILYLCLQIFGLGLVGYALMQSQLNSIVDYTANGGGFGGQPMNQPYGQPQQYGQPMNQPYGQPQQYGQPMNQPYGQPQQYGQPMNQQPNEQQPNNGNNL